MHSIQSVTDSAFTELPLADQSPFEFSEIAQINAVDRWSVYYRLQALAIPCTCAMGQPLRVQVPNPAIAIQLWSVVKSFTTSRQDQIAWLNTCWQQRYS